MLLVIHALLAVVEFFLINWMGKHSISSGYYQISFIQNEEDSPLFNVVFRVLAPTVFLTITAWLWYLLGLDAVVKHYWSVTAFYFVLRWIFNILMGRAKLLNWIKQFAVAVTGILLSVVVSEKLLVDRAAVLPSPQALMDQLWIVIIAFVYVTVNRINWPSAGPSLEERKKNYLRARYLRFHERFGQLISQHTSSWASEVLSYAVLIYEDFNRPKIYREIENRILYPLGFAKTLGPMQVTTNTLLPEEKLVELGVHHFDNILDVILTNMKESPDQFRLYIREDYANDSKSPPKDIAISDIRFEDLSEYYQIEIVKQAAATYNARSDYPKEIAAIFEFVRDTFYADHAAASIVSPT